MAVLSKSWKFCYISLFKNNKKYHNPFFTEKIILLGVFRLLFFFFPLPYTIFLYSKKNKIRELGRRRIGSGSLLSPVQYTLIFKFPWNYCLEFPSQLEMMCVCVCVCTRVVEQLLVYVNLFSVSLFW